MSVVTDLIINNEVPTGVIDGSNKVFTLSKSPNPEKSLELFINGQLQLYEIDYTLYNNTITFVVAPFDGCSLVADYRYVDIAELYLTISRIVDAGILASKDTADFNDDVSGDEKPDNNADVTGDHQGDIDGSNIINGENWSDDTAADAAQATADGKIVTFIQDASPTAEGVGDLWIDTNDTNKLYRWSGSSWVIVSDTDIAQAISDAAGAQATADGKVTTFYQDASPTAEGVGDFWIDTNDDNKPYRWSGSAWVAIDNPVADWSKIIDDDSNKPDNNADVTGDHQGDIDGSNIINGENWSDDTAADAAQATADGKIVTFIQDASPTAEGVGDLWIDTNDTNKLYRWSGSSWVIVSDTDIAQAISDAAGAQATADGKVTTFYQDASPTAEGVGDFWIDTNDDNKPYRWSGSAWVAIDNPVADWSKIIDDDGNQPADNATENTGGLADLDTVGTSEIDDEAVSNEKFKFNQFKLESYFESLDALTQYTSGSASISHDLASTLLSSGATSNSIAALSGEAWLEGYAVNYLKNPKFIVIATILSTTSQEIFLVAGSYDLNCFGFKITNGTLYALHKKDNTEYTTDISSGITLTNRHRYKAVYDSSNNIKFYIDDVLKATHSTNLPENGADAADEIMFFRYSVKTTTTSNKRIILSYYVIQQDT